MVHNSAYPTEGILLAAVKKDGMDISVVDLRHHSRAKIFTGKPTTGLSLGHLGKIQRIATTGYPGDTNDTALCIAENGDWVAVIKKGTSSELSSWVSDDLGKTWTETGTVTNSGNNHQPNLISMPDGRIFCLWSSDDLTTQLSILVSTSSDYGQSWSSPSIFSADSGNTVDYVKPTAKLISYSIGPRLAVFFVGIGDDIIYQTVSAIDEPGNPSGIEAAIISSAGFGGLTYANIQLSVEVSEKTDTAMIAWVIPMNGGVDSAIKTKTLTIPEGDNFYLTLVQTLTSETYTYGPTSIDGPVLLRNRDNRLVLLWVDQDADEILYQVFIENPGGLTFAGRWSKIRKLTDYSAAITHLSATRVSDGDWVICSGNGGIEPTGESEIFQVAMLETC